MKKTLTLTAVLLLSAVTAFPQHIIHFNILDENDGFQYAGQVHMDFHANQQNRAIYDSIQKINGNKMIWSDDLQDALTFLYAYMPQSDRVDYPFSYVRQQAELAFEAHEFFPWGKSVPANIFRHFVLPYRVNNENLDTARAFIFHQLKDRIKNMSMYEAALEVNHWCHEYVDYQPADVRTSAPLATIRTSHGRCGEESTLTVAALRAVGIPARQCYTPRWAHCDDNHAWVECYVDGQWHFLGACEPDPELDMGWFAVPASRTMMVHTNVFGRYNGPEEVNKKTQYYSCINTLANYAETVQLTVTVVDEHDQPIPNATVRFQLYNYAEYYTLAARKTDANGQATILTGKGDLRIWASQGDHFTFAKMDGRTQSSLTLKLNLQDNSTPKEYTATLDICPPTGGANLMQSTPERIAINDQRKHYEDSLREAYRNTWPTKESLAKAGYHNANFTDEQLYDIIRRSEGNYAEIMKFLDMHNTVNEHFLIPEYMAALADKDLRDAPADVLETQLHYYRSDVWPKDVFVKGVLPARISNELLRPDRDILGVCHKHLFHTVPTIQRLKTYIDTTFTIDPECNYYNCPISPMGVLEGKRSDEHSIGIFFVALCRSFGVPAYMDNSNGELYAWERSTANPEGAWINVKLKEAAAPSQENNEILSTIILDNPNHYTYYIHYTLQRFENGEYVSYDFENDPRVESDPIMLNVPAGDYCLSTGSRYSNGDVLSQMEFFTVKSNETVRKTITLRPLVAREHNYGHIDVDQNRINGKSLQQYMAESGKDRLILCLVTPGTEPVNHLTKEIEALKKEYEEWNGPVLFVASNANWKSSKKLPKNLVVTQNGYQKTMDIILHGLTEKHDGLNPVCIVVDKNGTIRFFSEGYHIGLGELLMEAVEK